ncbi:MAG: hypothetical protein OEM77_01635 [Nitrosopumilus sp.]|nr:hypothetical protein [Nitrosopumilus sp.]MDH3736194.1 hypothetical protein [Nitrosopumilus sp.]MDH3822528.1 hypothetical protein [Nitrosopumilus sp.]MDH3833469.1 hypothetical protein [Nitrosopumilus sp.]
MVQPCKGLWDWSWSCDISNLQTMTIEIIIAGVLAGIAIGAAVGFYYKEKSDRKESEKLIKKQGKVIEDQEKQKKNQLRFGVLTIENELKNLEVSSDLLRNPEPAAVDYVEATFRNHVYNLNNCLMVFPLEQLPNEFTDKLLDLLSYSKILVDTKTLTHPDNIIEKINELLNLISEIKKDFSQSSK